jgi:hypothetical protein
MSDSNLGPNTDYAEFIFVEFLSCPAKCRDRKWILTDRDRFLPYPFHFIKIQSFDDTQDEYSVDE